MPKTNLTRRLCAATLLALGVLALVSCNKPPAESKGAEPATGAQPSAGATDAPAGESTAPGTPSPPASGAPRAGEAGDETSDAPELPDTVDGVPAMMSEDGFLSAYRELEGVVVLEDGLMYRVIASGAGRSPKATDKVRVIYRGTLMDGSVFDETMPGETSLLDLAGAIAGWREALLLMKEGDKWEVVIPSPLAYGEEGKGVIPANMPLVFEIQLVEVMKS